MRSIVIPCFLIQGSTLPWTRCFAHSNNGGRPVRICCMRKVFPPTEVGFHRAPAPPAQSRGLSCRWWSEDPAATANSETNYEPFNSSSVNIRYWSWNYRGCWHQTCPPIDTRRWVLVPPIPSSTPRCGRNWYSSSLPLQCWKWAIFAPAALRGSSSRFSGSLSGIEP